MKISVGVSNRHIHLTKESLEILFGSNYNLEILKGLKQPGQFASSSLVTIKGPKGQIENVRILGPLREYNQVEVSKTDCYTLGINPPVRNSGDLKGSSPITIIGPKGELHLEEGCIIATRHIHISYRDLEKLHLEKVSKVKIKIDGEKGAILDNVYLKPSENGCLELHLDTDDANAHLVKQDDLVEVIYE